MKIALFSMILFVCFACSSSRRNSDSDNPPPEQYKIKALKKYGDNVEFAFDSSKVFVLCMKKSKPTRETPQQQTSFFVYDIAEDAILYENSLENGTVSWVNDHQVEVRLTPGILTKDEALNQLLTTYRFDVLQRRVIPDGAREKPVRP